jgi:hypothetical protein
VPRFGCLALMPIFVCMLAGCAQPEHVEPSNWVKQFKSRAIPPDHALIEIALIERPRGDEYINQHIWQHADELIVDLEKRAALDDNGLRVGQLVGTPPNGLQELITTPQWCRGRCRRFAPNTTVPIDLDTVPALTAFDLVQGGERTEVRLDQARFWLDVSARIAGDGQTILTFTPRVEHGAPVLPFHPAADRSTWELRVEKAAKTYPELSWEATLGTNQYLFIGGRMDRERSLGQAAFTSGDVQRGLGVIHCRAAGAAETPEASADDRPRADRSTPLALQAAVPASRGKAN